MSRIKRGWRLAKDSWAVLRADRSLTIFPVLSFIAAATAYVLIMAPAIVVVAGAEQAWVALPFCFLVASYVATFATVYFNVALTGAVVKSMEGHDTSLRDGLAVARERRGLIARWALVQWAVGLLISALQNGGRGGIGQLVTAIVSRLVGAAWAIASFFVVPILALEGLGPKDALKRSIAVIRERWGEGIVGHATIGGAVFLVGVLPALAVGGLGYLSLDAAPVLGVALLAVAIAALIAVGVIGSALNAIFRVTLFRFATEGRGSSAFADEDLNAAFRPK